MTHTEKEGFPAACAVCRTAICGEYTGDLCIDCLTEYCELADCVDCQRRVPDSHGACKLRPKKALMAGTTPA